LNLSFELAVSFDHHGNGLMVMKDETQHKKGHNHMTTTMMRLILSCLAAFVLSLVSVNSFSILPVKSSTVRNNDCSNILLFQASSFSSSSNDEAAKSSRQQRASSRLEGNQRIPLAEEIALMDAMIDKLLDAKPYELPGAVKRAFQVIRSPKFFLRIAERSDQAKTAAEMERLQTLAGNLVSTVEAVVETTKEQLDERASLVQKVIQAAAEPESGEFYVPLSAERIQAMQTVMSQLDEALLDDGFLSTLDSWIVKSHQDGMDLMVGILQKSLQLYAGLQISRALQRNNKATSSSSFLLLSPELKELLESDPELWESRLLSNTSLRSKDDVSKVKVQVQKTMETVIFTLETGSMAQQVQAEYLKELLNRIEAVEAKKEE
jgi:hypothetical protein